MLNPTLGEKTEGRTTVLGGKTTFFAASNILYVKYRFLPALTCYMHLTLHTPLSSAAFYKTGTKPLFHPVEKPLREALVPYLNTRSLIDQNRAFRGQPVGDPPDHIF